MLVTYSVLSLGFIRGYKMASERKPCIVCGAICSSKIAKHRKCQSKGVRLSMIYAQRRKKKGEVK